MLKRCAVVALLAPLTLGNLSRPAEAAGWGPLAALLLASHLPISPEAGWRHNGGFHRAPYYPRRYGGFYGDGGFYRAPYYPRYSGGYYGAYSGGYDGWCGGYGNYGGYGGYGANANYGGYDGYGYDGYGW
jgi:hypothetical protein